MENKYKISARLPNGKIFTYSVSDYEIIEGGLIRFTDKKFNVIKIFDLRLCEIEEVLR